MADRPFPLAELTQTAKAATPGEWTLGGSSSGGKILQRGPAQPLAARHSQQYLQIVPTEDAEHIAACSPDQIVALAASLQQFRQWLVETQAHYLARAKEQQASEGSAQCADSLYSYTEVLEEFDRAVSLEIEGRQAKEQP